jgi:hydroxymethylpyrimidine/phosphomethylpyrimidine kinase
MKHGMTLNASSSMTRSSVLVFAGLDPSGGAGIQADSQAIAAMGAHALPIVTTLTVQDNDRVYDITPVDPRIVQQQIAVLINKIDIAAIKIGIVGSAAIAELIASSINTLRQNNPQLPVVLDPVLASGHGDDLTREDAIQIIAPLRKLATLITPNTLEAHKLTNKLTEQHTSEIQTIEQQADLLMQDSPHVLIKGGHAQDENVINRWFSQEQQRSWSWPRLQGEFHGSGCTLASAIAAGLAQGWSMETSLDKAQAYTQQALESAFAIAAGQLIPQRTHSEQA